MESGDTTYVLPAADVDMPPAWNWRHVGAIVLTVSLATMAVLLVLRTIAALSGQNQDMDEAGIASPMSYIAFVLIYGILLLSIYFFVVRRAGWAAVGWRPAPWFPLVLTPLLLVVELFGMLVINSIIMYFSGGVFENPQTEAITGGQPLTTLELLLLLPLLAGLVPIAEELLFRGVIYPLLRHRWGVGAAVVGSAAIFAAIHFIPLLVPAIFFVGLILGLLREWSKSVVPGIILHSMQNGLVLLAINMVLSSS